MGCVNRSSKEFKQLALANNVDANILELITHKYWMERGSEDLFPTDLYIQAQLGNAQYQEPNASVRQLWKQQYSSSQEYSSLEQLQIAHREAMKFFPQSALVHYKDAKGNFVLSVKQPVENANYDKDSFFNEDNIKRLDLRLEEGKAYTIDKVEELFNRFNTDRTTKHLAEKVFKIAKDLGLGIKFDQSLPWGTVGRYTSNNTITYKKSFFELDIRNNMKAPILLHEVLHALSMYALSKQTAKWEKPEQLEQFKTEINSIYNSVKDNPTLKGEKGVEDIFEFVAELSNPIFRQKLQSIDKKSVWQKILDAFRSFFGIKTTSTYYQRAINSLDNALGAFDLDTYLRYNGVRNLMQQGYNANEWQFRDMTEEELKNTVKDYFKQMLPYSTDLKPETQKALEQAKKEAKASRGTFTYATETDDTGEYQKQSVQQRMDDFLSHYGDLVKEIKPFSNKYGGMSFTVTFKTPTELLRDQNVDYYSQIAIIDSISKDDIISEFARLEQESADYDLITEEGTKDSEKSSTFASDMAKSGNKKAVGPQPVAIENTPKPADQMNRRELWEHLESLAEPMGERPVSYTPVGKTRQQYVVKDGKVYNKKGEEVQYKGKDLNRILANLAVAEDRGVVVTYRDNDYVVDNHQNITSVKSGDVMKWGPENGDRKAIIQLAEQKFKALIGNRQNRLSEMIPELMDLLKAQGINIHDKAAMEKFLKENPQWSTKIQQFIGKKARTQFEQQLMKARPDLATPGYTVDGIDFVKDPFSDDFIPNTLDAVTAQRLQKEGIIKEGVFSAWALTEKGKEMAQVSHPEIDATLDFLHSLEDNKENTAYIKTAIRWIANKSLTLPQDHTKAYQAFELARKKHLDLQKYDTLGELITAPEMQPKKKEKVPFNPDKAKTFSNKRTVTTEGGRVFTVYDVENTDEGQREVCKALAAHYEMSPWCLSTFTATGEPTESAKNYWHEYEGVKRRIAFENGKPVAFSSDKGGNPKRYWLEIDGKELPTGIRMLNNLGQNMADGVGKKEFSPEALDYFIEKGYIERNSAYDWVIDDDAYKLTNKGLAAVKEVSSEAALEDREAWWDVEDMHPQSSLSDKIVADLKSRESMVHTAEQAAEGLGLLGTQSEIELLVSMQMRGIPLTRENVEEQQAVAARITDNNPFGMVDYGTEDLAFMQTPEGEVYGFADQKGDLYFDEEKVSPNVQIHEYTHLWDRAVAQRNPKLWKRGVDLMKQTSLWNEVLNAANYGQKWQAMEKMTPEKLESLIASEVHSRLTGTQGEALLNRIAKEKGSKGVVAKLKQWILDFWKELKGTFSNWSDEEINNLTLDNFNKMTVRDLIDKVNLKEQQQNTQQPAQRSTPASYEGMITPDDNTIFVFGSNPKGIHGAGAAATAKAKFGAIQGQGEGMQGNAYALPTKDLDKAKGTRWYKPSKKEEAEVKEWYKTHDYSEVQNHPLNAERTMTPQQIIESIKKLYEVANQNPDKQFKVSHYPFGQLSLNGYLGEEMLAMFKQAGQIPSNIVFNKEWTDHWNKVASKNPSPNKAGNSYEIKGSNLNEERATKGVSAQEILNSPEVRVKESKLFNKENILDVFNDVDDSLNISIKVKDSDKIIGIITWAKGKYWEVTVRPKPGVKYDNLSQKENDLTLAQFDKEETQNIVNKFIPKDLQEHFTSGQYKQGSEDTVDFLEALENEGVKTLKERVRIYNTSERAKGIGYNVLRDNWGIYTINPHTKEVNVLEANQVQGENITSKGSEFAKKLTNPGNNLQVEYKGKTFRNAEHAYQTWKSGEFDEVAYNSTAFKPKGIKPVNKETNYQTMVEILTAKLQQHPELIQGITERGGEAYLKVSTHDMIGDRYWETKTGQNKFIEALTDAYKAVTSTQIQNHEETSEGQRVSLPNYEYFMDRYEDTLVDAEWKIPLLKQLDAQIGELQLSPLPPFTTENVPSMYDKQRDVLDKMNKILEAKSEADLLPQTEEEGKQENKTVEQNLSEYDKLTQQINNLLDSNVITASEIRHIAELVVNSISDNITLLQKEDGLAQEQFSTLQTDLDFSTASRRDIVNAVGINRLIHRAKVLFSPEVANYEDIETMMQAALITDNWDAIMTLAADIFAANEGFGISRDFDKGGFKAVDGTTIGYDNFNNEGQDTETIEETEGDEQEHWQVESRTLDVLNSMSALVRLALHECYQVDKDGNKIYSKWGIAERVNSRQAVNSILRWTQGSLSLQDMINKLSNKRTENPWLTQLIDRLSDQSGKETDFQSQFYGVFSKHFQPYSIVLLEDGKYSSMPVNNHPALSEAMQTVTTQFKIGEHPLFTDGKVNIKLLGTENTTYPEADFNLHKALANLNTIKDRLNHQEELTDGMAKEASANIMGVCRIMGYPITEEMLSDVMNKENILKMVHSLGFIVRSLDAAYAEQRRDSSKQYNPFAFGVDNSIGGTLRNFLTPITEKLEDTAINAFYDSGKMYQSYVTPSFMTKLMNKFRLEGQEFEDFIMDEYGNSEWFKFPGGDFNKGWRNEWLRLLARDENARKVFDHKVELNFNKHNYMRNMSDAEYTLSLITEYFAETGQKGQSMVPAWFRIPMLSNKPSSEFIKFLSYRGDNYKAEIVNGLHQMFLQELSRIQTVRMRNHSKGDAEFINNFDTNGRKFNFLPFLNEYLAESNHSELSTLLKKKIEGLVALSANEEARLSTLVDQAIRQNMEDRVNSILDKWEDSGILEATKSIKGIGEEDMIRANVENFLWNDNFASKNILQLTIADIAFYKDAEDLQKRLAQLHAPGIRGNVAATDYEGNRVSDGTYRTFILQDFDSFKSNIIANIAEVFDRRIAATPENQKAGLKALKESLVGKDGKYTKINVTDAQGYSSPASYRKKAFIFGRWSREAESIYQKLKNGQYTYTDLETAFQPLKPFVYSHLQKDMGVANAPIQSMPVPFQAKNAEYLLIMADAILQGEQLGRPNLLRAVYRVMEESERLNPTKGIDTVQFESAIKSGLQGKLNIHQFAEMPGGEEVAFNYIMSQIYQKGTSQYNTEVFVHEAPYEDYCLQQEVPEHFKEHSQAHGSQIRMITPSDLDFYKNPSADHNNPNNQVFYEWTEPDGTKKKLRADEFRREYEETIAANISESIDNLAAELHFNTNDKRERNIALSKILQREILSSPRYGIDLIQACSIDKETGEFRIPKGDPIQAKRIEQLINSIIKNRVNKQKIAGGPIVQVSNFGTSRQLHIRFNDKNGGVLKTREEYEQNPQKRQMSQTDKFNAKYKGKAASDTMSYEEYVKENQAGIAYFEVFIPIWSNKLFEKFSNRDGTINVAAIEATDPELLKMVSYRIPTEDKYSCAPMKAVGFMPREAGDAIMFPYELTEIDDSDFDVDKRYVMRKDIPIKRRKRSEIEQKLFEKVSESYQKAHDGKTANKFIAEQIRMFLDNPDKMRHADALMESLYYEYQKIAYYTEAPTSGRAYRDNKIVDMTYAVLTNEVTADKILNPGGFDGPKKMGYMVAAYKNPGNNYTWQQLQGMSISELKDACYTDKDLTWADTQVQFYKQNSAAASLIGVFAVNKVAHATLESNGYFVAIDEICGQEPFTIADTEFGGRMEIDKKYDQNGALIGKTLGSLVSASADAVKDPILNLMNVNMTTAGMLNSMLRLGMSFDDAALFLSQDIIERALNEFNRQNLTNYQPLSTIIDEYLRAYRKKYDLTDDSNINFEPLTREELIEGLLPQEHEATDYKVLLTFQKLRKLVDAMRKPTFATRFNSISSAVGPLIIDNLIIEHRMEQFMDSSNEDGTHFYDRDGNIVDIDDIFYDHPVLKQFSRTVDIARQMFADMPAGSVGFRNLLRTLPEGLSDKIYSDKKLLDQLSNFYQSYLLVASRMINTSQLKNYIEGFPKWFMKQEFKEKYPDNALIQAIRMNVSKRTGRPYLSINITGIDEAKKEQYRNAWIDLHKDNPDLSRKLFDYCFFRAGVGFSPKTFMALVPAYVKERLNTNLGNDVLATYLDTYRHFPAVNPNVVIDQFIRNNWDNNKLVPKKGGEGTKYQVDLKNGSLVVRDPSDIADLKGVTYMKTRYNGQTYLWKQTFEGKDIINYTRVKPLGNNAEYLEMSLENIKNPLSETAQTIEDMDTTELQTPSHAETEATETSTSEVITGNERAQAVAELADLLMKQNPRFNKTEALNKIEEMKKNPKLYVKFLQNVFKQKGLNLNEEDTLNEFKKLC